MSQTVRGVVALSKGAPVTIEEITIPDTEFDNLFVIVRPLAGEPTLVRLRY